MVGAAKHPEVILNSDSHPLTRSVDGVETPYPPTTVEEKLARKNKLKAREGLDEFYDSLQKLISQLEIHGETISQKDLNLNLLRSLPSEWKTHTLIWRNKPDLETLSMDDLYNNLKIYEAEVMGSSSTTQNTQNVAFVSSNKTNGTNKAVNTAHGVSAASSKTNAFNLPNVDSLRDRLKMANDNVDYESQKIPTKKGRNLCAKGTETIGFNKTKVECYNCHRIAEDGPTNFALMAYNSSSSSSSSKSDTVVSTFSKACLKSYETLKEHYDNLTKDFNKSQFNLEKFKGPSKNLSRLLDSQQSNKSKTGLGYDSQGFDSQVLENQVNDKNNTSEGYHAVPLPYIGNFIPLKPDLVFAEEHVVSESITSLPDIVKSKVKTSETKLKNEKGVIDSEFSRYMTGNMSYLSKYEEIYGDMLPLEETTKEEKSLNNVLFIDTECLILSPNFKLLDESQVLLRVLRKNNMYSVDLKNVAPSGGLTCLFAKATLDESNLWHRRLGHINFKTMNKLDFRIFSGAYDDEVKGVEADFNNLELTIVVSPIPTTMIHKDHPKEKIIGDPLSALQTRRMTKTSQEHAMRLVDLTKGKHAIGTKWVYRNKRDERGIVVRNKARLVAQGYIQEERVHYDEVFPPVARIEAINEKKAKSGNGRSNVDMFLRDYKFGRTLAIGLIGKVRSLAAESDSAYEGGPPEPMFYIQFCGRHKKMVEGELKLKLKWKQSERKTSRGNQRIIAEEAAETVVAPPPTKS
nr:ribonuclease H-like domain-containing protein [Tanacetum cinerariifolium]